MTSARGEKTGPTSVRVRHVDDAVHIVALFDRLLDAFGQPLEDPEAQFAALATTLEHHFAYEELTLVPILRRLSEQDARVLTHEHRYIRDRLRAALTDPRAQEVRGLLDVFLAHEKTEERIVRRWLGSARPP